MAHYNARIAFENIDPNKPILVLTHNPNLVLSINRKYTYLMAGHFHGKQFNVPYLFQLIVKGKLEKDGRVKYLQMIRKILELFQIVILVFVI